MSALLRLNEVADDCGIRPSDHAEILASVRAHDRDQRRRAILALWRKPVVSKVRYDGVTIYRDNRGDEWTLWRALQATTGILLDRHWGDRQEGRRRARGRYIAGLDMAYWDSREVYGGYSVDCLSLYPGCRVSIFNDGDSYL